MSIRGLLIFALLILSTLFILQNTKQTTVSFLAWYVDMPLALLLVMTLGFGIVVGLIIPKKKR